MAGRQQASYQGYLFYLDNTSKVISTWKCTRRCSRKCKAWLKTTPEEEPVFTMSSHGNPTIQIGRYKFSAQSKQSSHGSKKRWACSKRSGGCRAYLVTLDNEIILYRNQHNH
ncbi:FLYWCH zinc finger domain-containing protein [Phthorimaea operculella]|nr:FLYWCH zinc finger domain-containing protein [Phthorimaea operculella]